MYEVLGVVCCLFLIWGEECSNPPISTPLLLRLLLRPHTCMGPKVRLLEAPNGLKRAQKCSNMPRKPSQTIQDHFWAKPFRTFLDPKRPFWGPMQGQVWQPGGCPWPSTAARPGTGSHARAGAIPRSGNQQMIEPNDLRTHSVTSRPAHA